MLRNASNAADAFDEMNAADNNTANRIALNVFIVFIRVPFFVLMMLFMTPGTSNVQETYFRPLTCSQQQSMCQATYII